MKLITAEEARKLPNKREEVDSIIEFINQRVRIRKAEGETSALIAPTVYSLSGSERQELFAILRKAGYMVSEEFAWPYFSISWQSDQEEA